MKDILPVMEDPQIQIICDLAKEIIPEHYAPYIAMHHIQFFLDNFQSFEAIKNSIENNYEYFLINFESTAVGYIGIEINPNSILLSKLYILKKFRGLGLGKDSMDYVFERARQLKIPNLELIVNQNNRNSIIFYEKLGFQIVESQINSFENGYSVEDYKMIKSI